MLPHLLMVTYNYLLYCQFLYLILLGLQLNVPTFPPQSSSYVSGICNELVYFLVNTDLKCLFNWSAPTKPCVIILLALSSRSRFHEHNLAATKASIALRCLRKKICVSRTLLSSHMERGGSVVAQW